MQWLAEICIKRPIFALMLVLSVTVAGVFSFFSLGVDLYPNVDVPVVGITVVNPGAAPQEIETEIIRRLEEEINTVSGIKILRSTANEGIAQIEVEFILEKNGDVAAQEIRDKVNLVQADLPRTAEAPIIQKFDANASPILQIAVSAPLSLKELYEIADKQIADQLEGISGVGTIRVLGGAKREIQIIVNPEQMQAYGLTADDVTQAIARQNQTLPGGRLEQGAQETSIRTVGKIFRAADFKDVAILSRDGVPVKIGDVAEIKDTSAEIRTLSSLNGTPAVKIEILKQSGKNTLEVAELVKEKLAEIKRDLPSEVQMKIVDDSTLPIEAAVGSVEAHLIEGSIFACIIVFVFLWNFRLTLISAVAIPTSIIGTFALMAALGYTLNTITLLALTLMVGIVIDDAIIVLENIFHLIEKGVEPFKAAVEGTREVGLAVLATTLSLLAVFVPVGFMGGIVGRFMASFGLTSAAAIVISLFVSFTLTPMLCARFIKKPKEKILNKTEKPISKLNLFSYIEQGYTRLLQLSMRFRWAIVVICVLVLLSNVVLFSLIGTDFMPQDDESRYEIVLRAPESSSLTAAETVVERIAAEMREKFPEVTETLTTTGNVDEGTVNNGTIFIKLKDVKDRERSQVELINETREMLKNYPSELRLQVRPVSQFGGGAAIQYLITGPDTDKLREYSDKFIRQIRAEVPEAIDVDSNLDAGKPELQVRVNRERAAILGIAVEDINNALNILIAGVEVSNFNSGNNQYKVRVQAAGKFRRTAADLSRLSVRSESGQPITLDQVVSFQSNTTASAIYRHNRKRQVTISANVRPGSSVSEVTEKIDAIFNQLQFDAEYKPELTGDAKEISQSLYYFLLAFALSFIFMYMVLAAQFESFIHPITILLTLPLAIPFGVFCLLITGQNMNIFVGLGFLVLFGIVKKNAILQIDHTNQLRAAGINRDEAIIKANQDRLRPILMTTLAFVAGMIPLLLSTGTGAATNRSIGTLVAGGQTLCLLLTLLAVPVFYSLFDDLGNLVLFKKFSRVRRKLQIRLIRQIRKIFRVMKSFIFNSSLIFIVIFSTLSAFAQDLSFSETRKENEQPKIVRNDAQTTNSSNEKIDLSRIGVQTDQPVVLTIDQSIRLAIDNNNEIRAAENDVRISEFNLKSVNGFFRPVISSETFYQRSVTPTSSSLQGGANGRSVQSNFSANFQLRGSVRRFGSNYQLEFNGERSSTNDGFVSLNPQFPTSFSFTFVQPLGRGLRTDENRLRIAVAKKNISLSDAQFRQKTIEIVEQTEAAYWDLSFALKTLQVQKNALSAAQIILESIRRQVEQGVLAPSDINQAEVQIAVFKQNLFAVQEQVTIAENNLKKLILPSRENPIWQRSITPVSPVNLNAPRLNPAEAMKSAFENRPEIAVQNTSKEINQLNSQFLRDKTKPQIDLITSYRTEGLAGKLINNGDSGNIFGGDEVLRNRVNELSKLAKLPPLPPIIQGNTVPNNLIGGFGNSLGNLLQQNYPTFRVGIRIEIPVGNQAAEADLGRSLAEGTRLEYERKQLEQNIEAEVRNALQSVRSAEERLKAVTELRIVTERLYQSEQRQFVAGTSTVFLVLERQTAFVNAQGQEVEAQILLNKSIANLRRIVGGTLEGSGVRLN